MGSGKININHFAHYKLKCTYPYGEPESEEHIKGKIVLKERLEELYPESKVYLEYKVEETNQRSDVMIIHNNGERWAFEVQLSKITLGILMERSELYRQAGIVDFWLFACEQPIFLTSNLEFEFRDIALKVKRK